MTTIKEFENDQPRFTLAEYNEAVYDCAEHFGRKLAEQTRKSLKWNSRDTQAFAAALAKKDKEISLLKSGIEKMQHYLRHAENCTTITSVPPDWHCSCGYDDFKCDLASIVKYGIGGTK